MTTFIWKKAGTKLITQQRTAHLSFARKNGKIMFHHLVATLEPARSSSVLLSKQPFLLGFCLERMEMEGSPRTFGSPPRYLRQARPAGHVRLAPTFGLRGGAGCPHVAAKPWLGCVSL